MEPRNVFLRECATRAPVFLIVVLTIACPGRTPSVIEGQALYRANGCTSCHGPSGQGDGPLAATLPSKPADLRYPGSFTRGATETEIAKTLAEGIPIPQGASPHLLHAHHELSMPRFDHLTEYERRSIALYVISLRAKPGDN
jgi:mono/diheme cytochrome c family protein